MIRFPEARHLTALTLASVALFASAAAPADPTAASSRIVVNVGTFRNQRGALGCRLFRSPAGFPDASSGTIETRVPIQGSVTPCTFENVAPGTYAIAVVHDENGNQRLDKNLFGVPTEGYGVSNNHTYALHAPKWDESTFVVESGKSVGLAIGLRY
jgi:uncharacterized protein (DUF2141 family)